MLGSVADAVLGEPAIATLSFPLFLVAMVIAIAWMRSRRT